MVNVARFLLWVAAAPMAVTAAASGNGTNPNVTATGAPFTKGDLLLGGQNIVPANMTEEESKAWLKQVEHELFEKPITRDEYERRNWMWVRCRTHHEAMFDMGGTWFGHAGQPLKQLLGRECPFIGWRFKYVNGLGWGDAMAQFHGWGDDCRLRDILVLMRNFALRSSAASKRDFYMWDCPGFEDDAHYGTEREGKVWPGPNESSPGPQKDSKSQDSINEPYPGRQAWGLDHGGR